VPPERQRAIANLVYKNASGNSAPDHGWKFRGRGLIFLRGQRNYYLCGKALNLDLISQPDLVSEPQVASRAAAWVFRNML
jgi:putative chitinase